MARATYSNNDAIIYSLWRARSHDFAKFPVKFPVSRENRQSRESSALLRQPIRSLQFCRQRPVGDATRLLILFGCVHPVDHTCPTLRFAFDVAGEIVRASAERI